MTQSDKIKIGIRRNTLLRYQDVLDYYWAKKKEYRYITITDLYNDFIYPKFKISRTTFYNILATPVKKELEALKEFEKSQLSLFA